MHVLRTCVGQVPAGVDALDEEEPYHDHPYQYAHRARRGYEP